MMRMRMGRRTSKATIVAEWMMIMISRRSNSMKLRLNLVMALSRWKVE